MSDKTTKPKKLPAKTESEILFPAVKVNKYTVEPWGLVEIGRVAPIVINIIKTCREHKIKMSFDNMEADLMRAMPLIIDDVVRICAVTVGVEPAEISAMKPRADSVALVFTILTQNVDYLKNMPGLLGTVMATIAG